MDGIGAVGGATVGYSFWRGQESALTQRSAAMQRSQPSLRTNQTRRSAPSAAPASSGGKLLSGQTASLSLPREEELNRASETLARMRVNYPDAQSPLRLGTQGEILEVRLLDNATASRASGGSELSSLMGEAGEPSPDLSPLTQSSGESSPALRPLAQEEAGEAQGLGRPAGDAAQEAAPRYPGLELSQSSTALGLQGKDAEGRPAPRILGSEEPSEEVEETQSPAEIMESTECQTCKQRKYQDGSDDPGVSFKTPSHLSPEEAESAVRGHEQEHVVREQAKADREGRKVVSQSVLIHTDICPECGRLYVSGGTTRTVTSGQAALEKLLTQEEEEKEEQEAAAA